MDTQSARLQEWMKRNGYEVKTLAQHLDFNPFSIYKVLNDERPASWEFRHRFAAAFGMEKATEVFGEAHIEHAPA